MLSEQAFQAALVETASQVFTGAVAAAAVGCVLSALEHGLEYQRSEIARDEMYQRIGRAVAKSAAVGGAVAGVMAGVALAFPALIPLAAPLMMPLAVLGFCTVGGQIVRPREGVVRALSGCPQPSVSRRFSARTPTEPRRRRPIIGSYVTWGLGVWGVHRRPRDHDYSKRGSDSS